LTSQNPKNFPPAALKVERNLFLHEFTLISRAEGARKFLGFSVHTYYGLTPHKAIVFPNSGNKGG